MFLDVLLVELHLAATLLEWAHDRSHWTNLFVLLQLAPLDVFLVAVVCALDWVVGAHRVVVGRYHLECIFGSTELALDVSLNTVLNDVFLNIPSRDTLATLVGAGVCLVQAPTRLGIEMPSEHAQFARPLAAFLVVWTVHLEPHHSLLEMDITKVVEIRLTTLRACVVDGDTFLDAALAKVASTAHDLAGVSQDSVA